MNNNGITVEKQKTWLFQKGESGNPSGRPKRSFSIKSKIIERLESNPEELEKMVQILISDYPTLVLQMIDGKPQQVSTQSETVFPIPLLENLNSGVIILPKKNEHSVEEVV